MVTCRVNAIEKLNEDTRRVELALPADAGTFQPGQYLELLLPHKNCPFSIASAPNDRGTLELHIRPTPGSGDSEEIEAWLDSSPASVDVAYPRGDSYLTERPAGPLVLLAASTGITQMNSILESLLKDGLAVPVYLYWGVVADRDLYINERYEALAASDENFHYVPVVSEPETSPDWTGRTGLVGDIALSDLEDVSNITVFVSGGPGMVYACLDAFVERGMPEGNMSSDVFAYAPRK